MTKKEQQLIESYDKLSAEELIKIIDDNDIRNFSEEYQHRITELLAKRVFTDDWKRSELDLEDAVDLWDSSLVEENWSELGD